MSKPFKPLLAKEVDFDQVDYGNLWLSPKLDGIRAIVIGGVVMSRSLKPIPNLHIQDMFGRPEYEHFDGELIVGPANAKDCYQQTNSGVMSIKGTPDAQLWVFDHIENPIEEYFRRYDRLPYDMRGVVKVLQHPVETREAITDLEEHYLGLGYEGVMLRAFQGPRSFYKYGRSTPKEGTLLKLKRFTDGEAKIIGFEEQMRNDNEKVTNELGRSKRSSHAENLVGKGTLGALTVEDLESGVVFNIGTGFDDKTKQHFWDERPSWLGRIVKYKSFKIGVKDLPRFPVYLGLRDPLDM